MKRLTYCSGGKHKLWSRSSWVLVMAAMHQIYKQITNASLCLSSLTPEWRQKKIQTLEKNDWKLGTGGSCLESYLLRNQRSGEL
jgi:hypothetical protein